MIRIDNTKIEISGTATELLTDLTVVVCCLVDECKDINREDIERSVKLAFMTPGERVCEVVKTLGSLADFEEEDKMDDFMESLFKDIFGKEM